MAMKRKIRKPNTILQNASTSAEIVASLDDLLMQILIKVPIKPLFRFKLVSKHWSFVISSREFCLLRIPTPNPAQGFFVCIEKDDVYKYEYVPLFPSNSESFLPSINLGFPTIPLCTELLHSCNGLMLCGTSHKWIEIDSVHSQRPVALAKTDYKLYVYNPSTNFSVTLPDWPGPPTEKNWRLCDFRPYSRFFLSFSRRFSRMSATLVFDPVKSPHYKVVLVVRIDPEILSSRFLIYSSETGSWSHGGEIGGHWYFDLLKSGVYWNGSIHWLNGLLSTRNPKNSIRFHVDTKMFGEMPSPPVVRAKYYGSTVYFGESCGHLHFIECSLPQFNVYEMKIDYSEWFVKYKVDFSPFIEGYTGVIHDARFYVHLYVLSFIRRESEGDSKLVLRIPGSIIKFNLVDETWETLCDFVHSDGKDGYSESGMHVLDYIQSLCSV